MFLIIMLIVKVICKTKKIGEYFYPTALVCFHCCDKHYLEQLGKKLLISLYSLRFTRKGSQGRNSRWSLEAEIEAESMEENCLLVCSPWLAQFASFSSSGPHTQGRHCPLWTLQHEFPMKNVPYRLAYRPVL